MEHLPTDEQILDSLRNNQLEAVFAWAEGKVAPVFQAHCRKFGIGKDDAMGLFRDAVIDFIKKASQPDFQSGGNLEGLLYQMAVFKQINQNRDDKREIDPVKYSHITGWRGYDTEVEAIKNLMKDALHDCLKKLPEKWGKIVMDYYSGYSCGEIAATLGSTEDSVKTTKSKAMKSLKSCIGD